MLENLKIFELEKLAEAENAEAQYALAKICLRDDAKIEQNYPAAIYWLGKAAENNYPEALKRLGKLYASGSSYVLIDTTKSQAYFDRYKQLTLWTTPPGSPEIAPPPSSLTLKTSKNY